MFNKTLFYRRNMIVFFKKSYGAELQHICLERMSYVENGYL